jgi:hypothetical protein
MSLDLYDVARQIQDERLRQAVRDRLAFEALAARRRSPQVGLLGKAAEQLARCAVGSPPLLRLPGER